MTEPIQHAIEQWTGHRQYGCPWFAFHDPFVARVMDAYHFFDKGQLSIKEPRPSHRLIEGVGFYSRMVSTVQAKKWEQDKERHEREMKQGSGKRGNVITAKG